MMHGIRDLFLIALVGIAAVLETAYLGIKIVTMPIVSGNFKILFAVINGAAILLIAYFDAKTMIKSINKGI